MFTPGTEFIGSGLAEHPKNWVYESEFLGDSSLQATPELTVILGLEKADSEVQHSIPYVFEERMKYNFCIDEDDLLIDSMKLVNAYGTTIARVDKKTRSAGLASSKILEICVI